MTQRQPPPTRTEIDALATDLAAELSEVAGEPDAVETILSTWLARHDVGLLGLIAIAVVRDVFAEYLTRVPADDVPPGAFILTTEGDRP